MSSGANDVVAVVYRLVTVSSPKIALGSGSMAKNGKTEKSNFFHVLLGNGYR